MSLSSIEQTPSPNAAVTSAAYADIFANPEAEIAPEPQSFAQMLRDAGFAVRENGFEIAESLVGTAESATPAIDLVVNEIGNTVDAAVDKAGGFFATATDVAADAAMVAGATTAAALGAIAGAIAEARTEQDEKVQNAVDVDGDGIAGISNDMQNALSSARDNGVFADLARMFEAHATTVAVANGVDVAEVALQDPALTLAVANDFARDKAAGAALGVA